MGLRHKTDEQKNIIAMIGKDSFSILSGTFMSVSIVQAFLVSLGLSSFHLGMLNVFMNAAFMLGMLLFMGRINAVSEEKISSTNSKLYTTIGILPNDELYGGGGVFGYTRELPAPGFDGHHVRPMDMWGWFESQETVGVSSSLFEEFVFSYQVPIMEKFGLISYGCCEPLNDRWDIIKRIPRLRRVSVSPWANIGDMAEKLGGDYIYCLKPSPADLAVSKVDEEYVRGKLRETMRLTRGCKVEILIKDNHTIGKNPQNVITWSRIAKEEAER